jgi:DNA (cytosine-5)-methyltransferase 1
VRILDLYCGAGGCSEGYRRAGFEVVGVDIRPQKRYPFPFIQGDALDVLRRMIAGEKFLASDGNWYRLSDFDAIHASPPCQRYSNLTREDCKARHPDLIGPTRTALLGTRLPYVIENVQGARRHLLDPLLLCGSMFNLPIWRHRFFEINVPMLSLLPPCDHSFHPVLVTGTPRIIGIPRREPSVAERAKAIGIDWMTGDELDEAIPPAYTEWIGARLAAYLLEPTP